MRTVITRRRPGTGSGGSARRLGVTKALAAAVITALSATACSGRAVLPANDHGVVVWRLPIPFQPSSAAGKDVVPIKVTAGERFSIKVETSDGPYQWSQAAKPDPHLVRPAGDFDQGSCAPGLVGCRVPYFHTLIAQHRGTTTMTWKYRNFSCRPRSATASPGASSCVSGAEVTFAITIG